MAKDLAILIGPKGKPPVDEAEEPAEDLAGDQRAAAGQALIDAIKRGDAAAVADAFEELAMALDSDEDEMEPAAEEPPAF